MLHVRGWKGAENIMLKPLKGGVGQRAASA